MIKFLKRFNWLFPILILFSLLLGTLGFYQYGMDQVPTNSWLSSLYLSLQLFVLNSGGVSGEIPPSLEIARFLAPAVTAGGIFLALWEPLHQNFLLFKIRFWKNHVVVCGLSKKAELLIKNFLLQSDEKFKIVLIELNAEHSNINHLRKKGVIFLEGSATHEERLLKANILKAKYILALTNDEDTNLLIAHKVNNIFNQYPEKTTGGNILQVIVHIDDFYTMQTFKEFHEKALPEQAQPGKEENKIDFHVFSIYHLASTYMVDHFSPDKYVSLSHEKDPPAHLLIMGNNLAAEYLVLEAAQMYHFPNLKKTRITLVADDVSSIEQKLKLFHPFLDKVVDITYISTIDFFKVPCPVACEEFSLCFLALDDDGKSIYYSRKLRQHLFAQNKKIRDNNINAFRLQNNFTQSYPPIKVLLPRNSVLVKIFDDVVPEMNELNIELLDLDKEICNKKTIVDNRKEEDLIAKHIHYEWIKSNTQKTKTSIGSIQEEWNKLKDEQKDSNRLPARHLFFKLRFMDAEISDQDQGEELNFDEIDTHTWERIARMEHNRWVAEKYINNFVLIDKVEDRNLGVLLKEKMKCHWDMVPFHQLDADAKESDTFTFRMAPVIAHLNHKRILKKTPRNS